MIVLGYDNLFTYVKMCIDVKFYTPDSYFKYDWKAVK